jgi:hypothetical protein
MNKQDKLELALQLVDQISNLVEGNEYEQFLTSHIFPVEFELKRQLTNIQHYSKLKE